MALNEVQLNNIIKESIKDVLTEKIKSKKLLQIANEHGGIEGLRIGDYLSEIPDEYILGVGAVDLHTYPHEKFTIDGISDDDMEQIDLNDGKFLYYDRYNMKEYAKDRRDSRNLNAFTTDGAFKYQGTYADAINKKKGRQEGGFTDNFFVKMKNAFTSLEFAKRNIKELFGMNTAFSLDEDINTVLDAISNIEDTLQKIQSNADDNLPNEYVDGGHFWRPNQPSNIQKHMRFRDSRRPNREGSSRSYYDVQNRYRNDRNGHKSPYKTWPYR